MTKKTIVQFLKTWDKYTKGDTAGFEPGFAQNLISSKLAKIIAADVATSASAGPNEHALKQVAEQLGRRSGEVDDRAADLQRRADANSEREADLATREADLATREADLAAREVKLQEALKADAEKAPPVAEPKSDKGDKEPGKPPVQGK